MNYLKVYCNLIRKAQQRQVVEDYTEKHHIFPVSIFGKNDKVVVLTGREHYIAHALLEKIYRKRYGNDHIFTEKMIYAHFLMRDGKRYYNSFLYESVRKKISKLHSKNFSGENNPRYGKIGVYKHTETTKEKQRNFNIENNIRPPEMGGWNKGKTGFMKHNEESKRKISESLKQTWAKRKLAKKLES
jgi:hypothetical protein